MDRKIYYVQQRIDNLEAKAKSEPVVSDAELQAQIARFLCVLSSGLVEQAIKSVLGEYAKSRSHQRVARYTSNSLSKLKNAKFEDILAVLGNFDSSWREYFESQTADEVKDAINSIVNNRNQIAHGEQVNITLSTFMNYYKSVKSFIEDLDSFIATQ